MTYIDKTYTDKLKDDIQRLDKVGLEKNIIYLKETNRRLNGFIYSPILTRNTYPFKQQINLNNLIIGLCEKRLKEEYGVC